MSPVLLTALVTGLVTLAACPVLVAVLRRTGRVDTPNARSSHTVPTPRGGGLAILAGLSCAAAVTLVPGGTWSGATWAAVGAATVLAVVGLVDDLRGLRPLVRLAAQVATGVLAGAVLGGPAGAAIGAVVVPAAVNMVNFMDGINGICAGHAAVWGVGAVLAGSLGGPPVLPVLGALSLGGALGFLPYNAPRARLFLGDVGSYLLGGLAGLGVTAALLAIRTPATDAWPLLGLVGAPYLLFATDTAVTIVRRVRSGEPILEAHRRHVYQQLANERSAPHWVVSLAMSGAALLVTGAFLLGPAAGLAAAVVAVAGYLAAPRVLHERLAA